MKPKTISTKIWRPVLDKLNTKLEQACLRRDAYLNRVLDVELSALDEELPLANSNSARQFIAEHLDKLDRKPVSLSLRPDLVERLDEICERKQIVRDSFFNRLFFFLAVPVEWFTQSFPLDENWIREVWFSDSHEYELTRNNPGFQNLFYPLEPVIDPFWALRKGLDLSEGNSARKGIYTVVLRESPKGSDLWGLNCYLLDREVPGLPEPSEPLSLDDLLSLLP
jgi:hypothetical protein